ncbi:MAG: hypothetical protein IPJ74_02105 [Saprospiraceae bacterium]|nr:hypothetical protein [Saprospiraceae bacterium]
MEKEKIFWDWFREHEHEYHFYHQMPDSPETDKRFLTLTKKLHEYSENLHFIPMNNFYDSDTEFFIITANCHKNYFEQAFKLIDHAPRDLPHWIFEALLPPAKRYTETYTISYEGIKLDPKTVWFRPMGTNLDPSLFGVTLFYKEYHIYKNNEDIGDAFQKLLITELGELSLTLNVHHLELAPLPRNPLKKGCLKLSKLPGIIERHKRKNAQFSQN